MNYKEQILEWSYTICEDGLEGLDEIINSLPSEEEIALKKWEEWVDYMNEHEPCPMGDHRVPPKLKDWLSTREEE